MQDDQFSRVLEGLKFAFICDEASDLRCIDCCQCKHVSVFASASSLNARPRIFYLTCGLIAAAYCDNVNTVIEFVCKAGPGGWGVVSEGETATASLFNRDKSPGGGSLRRRAQKYAAWVLMHAGGRKTRTLRSRLKDESLLGGRKESAALVTSTWNFLLGSC